MSLSKKLSDLLDVFIKVRTASALARLGRYEEAKTIIR